MGIKSTDNKMELFIKADGNDIGVTNLKENNSSIYSKIADNGQVINCSFSIKAEDFNQLTANIKTEVYSLET